MRVTLTPRQAVDTLLHQGADPTRYRTGLAEACGVTVDVIDAAIAQAGAPRVVDAETVAQERLAEDRAYARTHRAAWRAYQHEEE